MPIIFILSGVLLILICFGYIKVSNVLILRLIFADLVCLLLGYIVPDIMIGSIYVDVFFIIAFLISAFIFILIGCFDFKIFIVSIIVSLLYKLALDYDYSLLISFDSSYATAFLMICSLPFFYCFRKGLLFLLTSSLFVVAFSSRVDVVNMGFSIFNINFCFEVLLTFSLMFFGLNLFIVWIDYLFLGRRYVKTNNSFNFDYILCNI